MLQNLRESESILKKKRLRGEVGAIFDCIKKQTFGLFKKEEFEKLLSTKSKQGSYKDVAAFIRIYPLLLARVKQLIARIDDHATNRLVKEKFEENAVDLLPQGMALNTWLNRIALSTDKAETNRRKKDENLVLQTMICLQSIG